MPIERTPSVQVPRDFPHTQGGRLYKVKDGDDWESVARENNIDVKYLIGFNFLTTDPDEVNWYLRHYTGCNKVSPSGYNWMFSSSAKPGFIYIPPAEIDFEDDPHDIFVWTDRGAQKLKDQLAVIAQGISGNPGARIKQIVRLARRLGYPGCKDLWYYNPGPMAYYVQFHTNNAKRREMTKATNGTLPFDGDAGVMFGEWRIYYFRVIFSEFAGGYAAPDLSPHFRFER
jgi:hypothetical protein